MADGRGMEFDSRWDTTVSLLQFYRDPPNLQSEISELRALRRRKRAIWRMYRGRNDKCLL
jgi:hypothetical protein